MCGHGQVHQRLVHTFSRIIQKENRKKISLEQFVFKKVENVTKVGYYNSIFKTVEINL
mgnify:CR=1 FL=1